MEECCNKIVESIDNAAPTSEQSGSICGEAGAQNLFGNELNLVKTASLQPEIHVGTYIVPQKNPDFIYNCDGCIKSITLAVSPSSVLKDAQGQERVRFHIFTDKAGDGSIYQRREDAVMWNSSVIANNRTNRTIVEYRPVGLAELCFSQDDVFGFTIEAGPNITVLTRFPPDSRLVKNVSSDLESLPGCPQLSDSDLYMTAYSFTLTPLIHVVTGKTSYCDIHNDNTLHNHFILQEVSHQLSLFWPLPLSHLQHNPPH